MPIPEFVLALRAKIGNDPLPLPGVIAVVLDEHGRILLVRRSDTHDWALTTGCLEPGEQPVAGAVREVYEETAASAALPGTRAVGGFAGLGRRSGRQLRRSLSHPAQRPVSTSAVSACAGPVR
jgi:8-oxo-dGTP pyrophosphatase MutT (NUDIX family)